MGGGDRFALAMVLRGLLRRLGLGHRGLEGRLARRAARLGTRRRHRLLQLLRRLCVCACVSVCV